MKGLAIMRRRLVFFFFLVHVLAMNGTVAATSQSDLGRAAGLGLTAAESPFVTFRDVTARAGLGTLQHAGYGAAWADINGDGWLDVWITNHMYKPTLFLNNKDGTFSDVTDERWNDDPLQDKHGAAWADFDNDGDPDLIQLSGVNGGTIARDKAFYINHENQLVNHLELGLNDRDGRGRSPLWLDWNNDGRLDVLMANFPRPDNLGPTRLMIQQPNGSFQELASFTRSIKSFYAQLASFDGMLHLVAAGTPYPGYFYRVGDLTPLSFTVEDGVKYWGNKDSVIADFDNDLNDDVLLVGTVAEGSGLSLSVGSQGETKVLIEDTAKQMAPVSTFTFTLPETAVLSVRLFGKKWERDELRVGALAKELAKVVRDDVMGRSWRVIEVQLRAIDDSAQGEPSPDQRTSDGIYVSHVGDGRWVVHVQATIARGLDLGLFTSEGEIKDFEYSGFTPTNIAKRPLLLLRRSGQFHDVSKAWGLGSSLSCQSAVGGDFDNDMDVDLYLACSDVVGNLANRLFENTGGGFLRVTGTGVGATQKIGSGGRVSVADFDNDGFLDLLVTDGSAAIGYPVHFGRRYLFHNQGNTNRWIQFTLQGCATNRDGIGSRVIVEAGGKLQQRVAGQWTHNGAQDQPRLHFGLASNLGADDVTVHWASGNVTHHGAMEGNRVHILHEAVNCLRP